MTTPFQGSPATVARGVAAFSFRGTKDDALGRELQVVEWQPAVAVGGAVPGVEPELGAGS